MENKIDNTPQSQEKVISLNGFEIQLSLNGRVLTIQAEEQGPNSRLFTTELDDTQIENQTKSLFTDCAAVQRAFQDAFACTDSSMTLIFSDEGKLIYSCETMIGSQKRRFEFAIPLTEIQLDPLKTLERKVEKLHKKVEEQEILIIKLGGESDKLKSDSFSTLERIVKELQKKVEEQEMLIHQLRAENAKLKTESDKALLDKIEVLEKILPELFEKNNNQFEKKLEAHVQEKIHKSEQLMKDIEINFERRCNLYEIENRIDQKMKGMPRKTTLETLRFHTGAKNVNYFTFSNNNEAVTLTQNSWKAIYANKPLSKTLTSFSIKIDHSVSNHIMVGIIPANLLQSDSCYSSAGAYMYYAHNGYVYVNGSGANTNALSASATNSIITVIIDLSANKIEWNLNNGKSWSTTLSNTNNYDYYPCIELYNKDDKVSFISMN